MRPGSSALAVLAVLWAVSAQAQPWWVRGAVLDAATGQPLPAATLRLAGTFRGTIANDEGEYRIEVRSWPATLRVSHIGYASRDTLLTAPPGRVDFALAPAPYRLEPLVVTPGDPAEGIMARVIRNKQVWRPLLASYRARAYTRRVLENDEGIVTIGETGSEIFWDRDRGLREVVRSRRTTRNLDAQSTYASALEGFVDFYDDDIPMAGHTLVGPTHPEALDHYRFRLAGRRYLDDRVVYDISVEPRSRLAAAFSGRVSVLDGDFVLLEAELAPSRAVLASVVPLPVLERLEVSWRQQFRGFGEVWLPVDQRFSMEVEVGIVGLRFPTGRLRLPHEARRLRGQRRPGRLALRRRGSAAGRLGGRGPGQHLRRAGGQGAPLRAGTGSLRHHRQHPAAGAGLPAQRVPRPPADPRDGRGRGGEGEGRTSAGDRRRGGPAAGAGDRLEARSALRPRRWSPPRPGGEAAGGRRPGGRRPRRGRPWSGAPVPEGPGLAGLEVGGGGAWDLGLKRGSWRGHAAWGWEKEERTTTTTPGRTLVQSRVTTRLRIDLEYGSGKAPRSPSDSYTPLLNSAQALLGLDDYFDWYWREGLRARLRLWLPGRIALEAGLRAEDHSSLAETTTFNLPWRDWRPRPNPPVDEGRLRSLEARFEWGGPYRPFGLRANRRVELPRWSTAAWAATSPSRASTWLSTASSAPS